MYIIRVSRQGEFQYELDFNRPQFVIGRGADADIVLAHGTVSRRHACIYWGNAGFGVVDLGSSNGTFINGYPIQGECLLRDGDIVYCGIFTLEVRRSVSRQTPSPYSHPESSAPRPMPSESSAPRPAPEPPPASARPPASSPAAGSRTSKPTGEDATKKTLGPGDLNVADLHAEMMRRRNAKAEPEPSPEPEPPSQAPPPSPPDLPSSRPSSTSSSGSHSPPPFTAEYDGSSGPAWPTTPSHSTPERVGPAPESAPPRPSEPRPPALDAPAPSSPKTPSRSVPTPPSFAKTRNGSAIPAPSFDDIGGPSVLQNPSEE